MHFAAMFTESICTGRAGYIFTKAVGCGDGRSCGLLQALKVEERLERNCLKRQKSLLMGILITV
jgi:hypothetical protein